MRALPFVAAVAMISGTALTASAETESGMVVLNSSDSGALRLVGNASVHIPAKIVYVNSSSSTAVETSGTAVLDVPELRVVGKARFRGNAHCTGVVQENAAPVEDPYRSFMFPKPSEAEEFEYTSIGSNDSVQLQPGYYTEGITISGNADVEFTPGVYFIGGYGLKVRTASVTGSGVTLVMLDGPVDIAGSGHLNLSPPVSGPTSGMVLVQPASNTHTLKLAGGSETVIYGNIYAPGAELNLVGNSEVDGKGPMMGDVVVADRISLSGTAMIRIGRESSTAISLPAMPLFD